MTPPLVSFIVPVYNKSHALAATLASLRNQDGPFASEFIFIDDASTDDSVAVLERHADSRVRIIRNGENCGPAVRLNQGARVARGEYLQFVDADDILARGATAEMLRILREENADVIYGKWRLTKARGEELLEETLAPGAAYTVSERPLHYVLTHSRIVRMVAMTTGACFAASGGCDEGVFVQDESLPLRLAWKARRFVDFSGTVILVPAHEGGNLSQNKVQQHHDGFRVFRNALEEMSDIDLQCRRLLQQKAISIAWKHYRRTMGGRLTSGVFQTYLLSKTGILPGGNGRLDQLYRLFNDFHGRIRKPCPGAGRKG